MWCYKLTSGIGMGMGWVYQGCVRYKAPCGANKQKMKQSWLGENTRRQPGPDCEVRR